MTLDEQLARSFLLDHPSDAAVVLERMPLDRRAGVMQELSSDIGPALEKMMAPAVAECLPRLGARDAAAVLDRLPLDRAVAILRRLPQDEAERLIQSATADRRDVLGRVISYPEGTAGALMDPLAMELPIDASAAEARLQVRRSQRPITSEIFVIDRERVLVGLLEIAELLRAGPRVPIRTLVQTRIDALPAWMPAAAARKHPRWNSSHAMPVVDDQRRLMGVLHLEALRRLVQDAEGRTDAAGSTAAVIALGELFHLGLAGIIEGVASAASPQSARPLRPGESGNTEGR